MPETLMPSDLAELSPRRKYLIGVSGGVDSMVLLHVLHALGYHKLVVCHLNHRLRGRASEADSKLVLQTASRLGYPCLVESVTLEKSPSLEAAAREARHHFFVRCARRQRCRRLLLAHHADDQAETVLMNVLRGSGLRGMGGMRAASTLSLDGITLTVLRPLLQRSREQLWEYAQAHHLRFREDATNASRDFLRNRLRHDLIPQASIVLQRDVRPALCRLAKLAQEDESCLAALAGEFPLEETLSTQDLLAESVALQRRILHGWLQHHQVTEVTFELVEDLRALLPPTSRRAKYNLPGGHWARRRAGRLFIERDGRV